MNDPFATMTAEEVVSWTRSGEFKQLLAELFSRAKTGEEFSIPEGARFLCIPVEVFARAVGYGEAMAILAQAVRADAEKQGSTLQ
jgi:hypothetical protein